MLSPAARCCCHARWKNWTHPRPCISGTLLAQAARAGGGGMLCRRQDETFCLAYPWDPRVPRVPLTPAFCLARVQAFCARQPHVIFRFRPEGGAHPPTEEE